MIFVDCYVLLGGSPASTSSYSQHSSAAGGAGGGALQLQAGRLLQIDGVLDASGGDGGGNPSNEERLSASGGGGGGAALLQSESLLVTEQTLGRIDVSGGSAGVGAGNSLGGRGGAGLLRMETVGSLPSLSVEAEKILPDPEELATLGATPQDILSIGGWPLDAAGPGARSGARSCWMRPEGVYFLLRFLEDEGDELGWDMRVVLDGFGEVSYRGDNPVFGESLEDTFGSELGAAPVLVRFQGARTLVDPLDLCAVELHGADAEIFPGSLTGWVEHPAELNDYFSDPSLRPNLVRYQVVFDRSDEDFGPALEITELRIEVQPE